ncbi:hypothetical protein D9615_003683 [Tricholomella constricta]|uniref:CCHC-type domain-containing protein n=1 Tax=Tricholomella constricta TaxID=117010 RepID=A0A8H5HIE6_9AGAR|nr:hypothetical protein D9615_003683 [Tricholomella constricta]
MTVLSLPLDGGAVSEHGSHNFGSLRLQHLQLGLYGPPLRSFRSFHVGDTPQSHPRCSRSRHDPSAACHDHSDTRLSVIGIASPATVTTPHLRRRLIGRSHVLERVQTLLLPVRGKFRRRQRSNLFGTTKDVFPTWKDFEDTFRSEFFLLDEVANAALTLESTAYFQNSRSIDKYIDSFRSLWVKAGYPDGRHLVLKFRRGMDPKLSRRLGSITTGRLHDNKIEEWLRTARSQDFIMRTEDDFHRQVIPTKAAAQPLPQLPLPQSIPMDVDRMRDRVAPADDHCFRCKKKGHFSRDCPLRWDVRHMLDDKLEVLIMERLACKDAVSADQTPSSADAGPSDAEEGF